MTDKFEIEILNSADGNEMIRRALATITPRQEKVLRMALGVGMERKYSVPEIASVFHLSTQRIYQIKREALHLLKIKMYGEKRSGDDDGLNETEKQLLPPIYLIDIVETVTHLSPYLINHLKVRPADLDKLPWDVFEHLIAEFFASWGYEDVRLVGRDQRTEADIYAVQKTDTSGVRIRYFVEVKHTRNRIGIEVINGVFGAMTLERPKYGWHIAMIVSLAGFKKFKNTDPIQLKLQGIELRDGNDVLNWIRDYSPSDKGLWLAEPVRRIRETISRIT